MFNKKESGRSMIEMLGVLAIIGILSAGGIAGYTMAMKNYRANKAMERFQLLSTEIITAFGENNDFTKLPGNEHRLKLDLTSPYGGNIDVEGYAGNFVLIMKNVPEQTCIKIAQSDWGDDYVFGISPSDKSYTLDPLGNCTDPEDKVTLYMTYEQGIGIVSGNNSGE